MRKLIPLLAALALFSGCGQKKIDGSSMDKMADSIEAIEKTMSDADKEKFQEALRIVTADQIDGQDVSSGAAGAESSVTKIRKALDGKTAAEVIAAAEAIKAKESAK